MTIGEPFLTLAKNSVNIYLGFIGILFFGAIIFTVRDAIKWQKIDKLNKQFYGKDYFRDIDRDRY